MNQTVCRSFKVCCAALLLLLNLAAAEDTAYNVGTVVPLTGMVASMGQATQNGILLFKEREKEKAAKLNFIFEDSKYDGKETLTAIKKLARIDQVSLLMVWGNTPSDVAEPITKAFKLDTVFVSHDDHSSTNTSNLDLGPSFSAAIDKTVARINQIGIATFGSLAINVGNVIKFLDTLDQKMGTTLYREIVPIDSFQFQAPLLKGKSKNIKEYLLVLLPEQALQFAKQSKDLKLNYKIIGGDVFAEEKFLKEFIQYQPDTSLIYGVVEPWFSKAYIERFGNSSYLLEAASGYTFAQIAAELADQRTLSTPLQEKIRKIDLSKLAYKNAKIGGPGVRISAPTELIEASAYLRKPESSVN